MSNLRRMPLVYLEALKAHADDNPMSIEHLNRALAMADRSASQFARDLQCFVQNPRRFGYVGRVTPDDSKTLKIAFHHGLGDATHIATMLQLWRKRGYRIEVGRGPFDLLWRAAGFTVVEWSPLMLHHPWVYPGCFGRTDQPVWEANKIGYNLCGFGLNRTEQLLPPIGHRADLWPELLRVRLDARPFVGGESHLWAAAQLTGLPRPWICLHNNGNSWAHRKDVPTDTFWELQRRLLDRGASLLLLNHEKRMEGLIHDRVRSLTGYGLAELAALLDRADLLIGIDSGPAHFASLTQCPTLFVGTQSLPVPHVTLPSARTTYLAPVAHQQEYLACGIEWRWRWFGGSAATAIEIDSAAAEIVDDRERRLDLGRLRIAEPNGDETLRKHRTCLVTYHSHEYQPLADVTTPTKEAYCARHGYDYLRYLIGVGIPPVKGDGWERMRLIRQALEEGYDTVFYLDADALITNPEVSLDEFEGRWVVAADVFGINTGSMIVRQDPACLELLYAILEAGPNLIKNHWAEQESLIRFTSHAPYRDVLTVVEQERLNAYPNWLYSGRANFSGCWRPGAFVLHLPGLPMAERIKTARECLAQCESWQNGSSNAVALASS